MVLAAIHLKKKSLPCYDLKVKLNLNNFKSWQEVKLKDLTPGIVLHLCWLLQLFSCTSAGLDSQQRVGNFYTATLIPRIKFSLIQDLTHN